MHLTQSNLLQCNGGHVPLQIRLVHHSCSYNYSLFGADRRVTEINNSARRDAAL